MSAVKGWKRESLGAQLKLIRNGYSGQQVNQFTNFPVSRIETISDGTIDLNKVGYVDFIPDSYLLQSGDILFSNINSLKHIGKVAQVSEGTKLFHGMNLLVLRPVEEVDKKFLFYKLINAKLWFEKVAAQAINQASINQGTIKELRIELPQQKPEQTKIAEILSTVDRAIEQTEALIAKQQRIKTGLMQDLLTRGIDEHGNLRSEQTHEFKDSPLGRIPVEWEIRNLDCLTKAIIDCPHTTPTFTQDGILVARTFNMKNGQFLGERSYVSESEYNDRILRLEPQQGDVIFTREAPVGEAYVIPASFKVCLGQRTMLLRCDLNKCLPEYLVEVIYSEEMRNIFYQKVGGTTNPHLNVGDVRYLVIKQPPINEQQKIIALLGEVRRAFDWHSQDKSKLSSLKIALMQDLLTGKKRVTTLLEKIP